MPVVITTTLQIAAAGTTVTVEGGGDLLENDSTFHTDVDRDLFNKLPLESQSSGVSSLVTLATPGVAADSNGLFHGLGDHASNSFSVDGQPITDQQSKVFSNQIPSNSIQSIEVISGAPPAEYGDKTSLVIEVTTRSGLNNPKPTGSLTTSYGTFGSATAGFDLGYGTATSGNFLEIDGLNTGRFLDPPEFKVFHDKGNEQNVFDRADRQFTPNDSAHLNLTYSRSWFQTPNTYDNLNVGVVDPVAGDTVGATDQHSKIETYDIAPTYTHIAGTTGIFNFGPFIRHDNYNYYPSHDPFADLGPIQTQTIAQERTLLNTGVHTDFSYAKGINNAKVGAVYEQTILRENDSLGVVSTTYNSPCLSAAGAPVSGFTDPTQCAAAGDQTNPAFAPALLPYDLTRGGGTSTPSTDIRTSRSSPSTWKIRSKPGTGSSISVSAAISTTGLPSPARPSRASAPPTPSPGPTLFCAPPMPGRSKRRSTRTSSLSSTGCTNAVLSPLLLCSPGVSGTLAPGFRNEFHAGLQQAFGAHVVISGDYIWKYTHNAFRLQRAGKYADYLSHRLAQLEDSRFCASCGRDLTYHHITAFAHHVVGRGAASFRLRWQEPAPPSGQSWPTLSASITMSASTRPPTSAISCPDISPAASFTRTCPSRRPGLASTGGSTAGMVAGSSTPCYSNPVENDPNSACAGHVD